MNPNNEEINKLTKESLAFSVKDLMIGNKNLSVTNICQKAGVSRNAFYRNFETVDDIIVYYLTLRWSTYAEENNVEKASEEERMIHLTRFFYGEKEFIRVLRNKNMVHLVEKMFVTIVVPQEIDGGMRYYLYTAAYLMYGFIRAMIDNDFSDTPEQIEIMAKILKNGQMTVE